MERLWGDVLPVPAARVHVAERRRADHGRRARAGGRVHARACLASRQLLRSRRAASRSSATRPASGAATAVVHHAADAATRHRSRGLAGRARIGSWRGIPTRCSSRISGHFVAPGRIFRSCSSVWTRGAGSSGGCSAIPRSTTQERERRFVEEGRQDIRRTVGDSEAEQYSRAGRLDYSWQGLARYWRSRLG